MPISQNELLFCLSGGSANSDPDASLGGGKSNTTVSDATMNNLFDDVAAAEAQAGDEEYRGLFLMNTNSTLTLSSPKFWISASTTAPGDEWYIATDTSGFTDTHTMSSISDESTEPTIVSWVTGTISLDDFGPTKSLGVWVKRSVSVGAGSYASNSASLAFSGETA